MKAVYNFKHLDHSDSLQAHTQNLLDRVSRHLLKEGHAQVWFSKKKKEGFHVEVLISTADRQFRASHFGDDPYGVVDGVGLKLEKQLLKNRKIVQNHKRFELSKEGRLAQMTEEIDYSYYRKSS